jgi:hypothetical protein
VDPKVTELLKQYVVGELWTDRKGPKSRKMDEENNRFLEETFGPALPLYVLYTTDGKEVARIGGRPSVEKFVEFLKRGLDGAPAQGNGTTKP